MSVLYFYCLFWINFYNWQQKINSVVSVVGAEKNRPNMQNIQTVFEDYNIRLLIDNKNGQLKQSNYVIILHLSDT